MKAKIGDTNIIVVGYEYDTNGNMYCKCRVDFIPRIIPILATLITLEKGE